MRDNRHQAEFSQAPQDTGPLSSGFESSPYNCTLADPELFNSFQLRFFLINPTTPSVGDVGLWSI